MTRDASDLTGLKLDISDLVMGYNSQHGCLASTSSVLREALPQWGDLWVTMETGPDPVQLPQSRSQRPVDNKSENFSENPQ